MFNTMKCPRCAQKIKADAGACPFCGFDLSALPMRQGSRSGGFLKFFVGAMVLSSTVMIAAIIINNPKAACNGADRVPSASNDPSMVDDRDLRVMTALMAGEALRDKAGPAGTPVIEEARATRNGEILCVRYHIEHNGDQKPSERLVYHNRVPGESSGIWDMFCPRTSLDVIDSVAVASRMGGR